MELDNNNMGVSPTFFADKENIKDERLKRLFTDIKTVGNIYMCYIDFLTTTTYTFMSEAEHDLSLAVKRLDEKDFVGSYGHMKAASELMLMCLYMNAPEDPKIIKEREKQWRNEGNDFGKIFKDHTNWPNFKIILNNFPSWKNKQSISDKRINRSRHKHSIKFFEVVFRSDSNAWNEKRIQEGIIDCKYLISMFIITWMIIEPLLPVLGSDLGESRYPGIMSSFPTVEFTKKYLPELDETFLKESDITKDLYKQLLADHEYTLEQQHFKGYDIISPDLYIPTAERKLFSKDQLSIYDIWKNNPNILLIVKQGGYKIFLTPAGNINPRILDGLSTAPPKIIEEAIDKLRKEGYKINIIEKGEDKFYSIL